MVKKPFKGNYLTFEVRASYDEDTDSIHLTSKDKDIPTENGFHLALNGGRDAEYALRTLLEQQGIIPKEKSRHIPSVAKYEDSPSHDIWDKFPLGIQANGVEAVWNSSDSNNVLINGYTGSGKAIIQRNIIFHCIRNSDRWMFLGIDPKKVELTRYSKYAPTTMNVVTSMADGVELLRYARNEMLQRYEMMKNLDVSHVLDLPEPPKSIMIMVDQTLMFLARWEGGTDEELAENQLKEEASYLLNNIACFGRPAGIHLVLTTQRIDMNIFNYALLENCTTRIAAGRLDSAASKMLLGNLDATRLNGAIKGRGYVQHHGKGADFQAYYAKPDFPEQS